MGTTGGAVLALSVAHCTSALSSLTGSNTVLAGLMAVGIDCGLVACELATVVAGRRGAPGARRWAAVYVVLAVALSVLLNGYASAAHAPGGMLGQGAAWVVGGSIPVLVLILGRVAALLWDE